MTSRIREQMNQGLSHGPAQEAAVLHAQRIGALALGALAIGAIAIGAVAIGRLAIGRARIRRLEIDDLIVRRLRLKEELQVRRSPGAGR